MYMPAVTDAVVNILSKALCAEEAIMQSPAQNYAQVAQRLCLSADINLGDTAAKQLLRQANAQLLVIEHEEKGTSRVWSGLLIGEDLQSAEIYDTCDLFTLIMKASERGQQQRNLLFGTGSTGLVFIIPKENKFRMRVTEWRLPA